VGGASVLDSDKGSLFSLIPNPIKFGQLAAPLADKIFKGMPPGNIPIVTPESDLEINYKAITKLGLTVDEGLLSRATRIIR
jgi:putative ABC transport system substrate-binding protein